MKGVTIVLFFTRPTFTNCFTLSKYKGSLKKISTFDFNMRKQFIFDLVYFVTISYKQLIFVAGTLVASCYVYSIHMPPYIIKHKKY